MSENNHRLNKVAAELNKSFAVLAEHLNKHGFAVDSKPTTKISDEMYKFLLNEFQSAKAAKDESKAIEIKLRQNREEERPHVQEQKVVKPVAKPVEEVKQAPVVETPIVPEIKPEVVVEIPKETPVETPKVEVEKSSKHDLAGLKVVGKLDMTPKTKKVVEEVVVPPPAPVEEVIEEKVEVVEVPVEPEIKVEKEEVVATTETPIVADPDAVEKIELSSPRLRGLKILDKIEVKTEPTGFRKEIPQLKSEEEKRKRKRKKINVEKVQIQDRIKEQDRTNRKKPDEVKQEVSEKEIQDKIKSTLAKLEGAGKGKGLKQKIKRQKREDYHQGQIERQDQADKDSKIIKVTEFVSANELASMMNVSVNEIITACFSLGLMVSINQRLDAETLSVVAQEFGFDVEFVDAESQIDVVDEIDKEEDLVSRPPIVTVMGHVDHGKTSLLDYIREANVIAGEAGGITQHIGAYEVTLADGKKITFLDTPGHEAFTAMRARGAKLTDISIIVIAADDNVMPQTKEAISHAQAAGVPMVFAINKIDKEGARPEKIKEELSAMNILVEDWGGKFQSQEISAKKGINVDKLLEKVLLEAEMLELKANPNRLAKGTVIESSLDKGRGMVTNMLVQNGTLHVGDFLVAGPYYGKVKALFNERGAKITSAPPATPVKMLGFGDAPTAGDTFVAFADEYSAKELANKRFQLVREQGLRTRKHITLDEIGRRLAVGNFKELKLIVKGDVDGSVEALSDALLKLSTPEIQVNVIHKAVGQITESDILLASASDAIVIGFQVRPAMGARKLAEAEEIDIRLYSIIYQAIDEIKAAMEGMLSPEIVEKIIGNVEVREVYKITKVGTIAGCYVTDGKIERNAKLRLIRDGVVVYTGELSSLKRFKDDVKEVARGYECGLQIRNYNDLHEGDYLEFFKEEETKRKLD